MNPARALLYWATSCPLLAVSCLSAPVLPPGECIQSIDQLKVEQFLKAIGQEPKGAGFVTRLNDTGKLFIKFASKSGENMVVIVSSNRVLTMKIAEIAIIDNKGEPILWGSNKSVLSVKGGATLPARVHPFSLISDGRFAGFFTTNRWWVTPAETPTNELIRFTHHVELQLIRSTSDTVHVFVTGQPEGKPRTDHWAVLKRYEYRLKDGAANLSKVQDFPFSWSVLDFDAASGMALVSSWSTYFAHAILVDTKTGERKDLKREGGKAFILNKDTAEHFERILSGKGASTLIEE